MKSILLPLFALLLCCTACGDDAKENLKVADCGPDVKIVDVIAAVEPDAFTLVKSEVQGLCLEVTIAATGCGSQGWKLDLVTFGEVRESSPTQTSARFLFDDGLADGDVTCQAEITETYSFDLSPYLTPDVLPTYLTLTGTDAVVAVE